MPDETGKTTTDNAREDLKNAKDDTEVWAVIKKAIANLINLEIRTMVTGGQESEELYTRIDLFQADRTNQIHKNFLKDADLAPLRDFHTEQVKLAEADIQKKLDFLESIGHAIIRTINPEKK